MDKIHYTIKKTEDNNSYDINLYLNDEHVLPYSLLNVIDLLAANDLSVDFYLFTCSCGSPGCAGIFDSVLQSCDENFVEWKFVEDNSYKTLKNKYIFNKKEFQEILNSLKLDLLNLEKEKYIYPLFVDIDFDIDEKDNLKEKKEIHLNIEKTIKRASSYFKKENDYNNFLKSNYPSLVDCNYIFEYDNLKSEKISFSYLIGMLINDYINNNSEIKKFYKKTRKTINAINEFIDGNNENLKKIINKGYKNCEMNYNDFRIFELLFNPENISKFDKNQFDFDKMKLVKIENNENNYKIY